MSRALPNAAFIASPNYAAQVGPNYAAYSAPNYAAYSAPNYAAQSGPNYAAFGAPNYAAQAAANYAAALADRNYHPLPGASAPVVNGTGAGGASGTGFRGGYGAVARFEYATPAALAPLPWIMDFASGDGWPSFPLEQRLNPLDFDPPLQWQTGDWDPGLRFWTLDFDPQLTEWLLDLDLAAPAVMAAREFAMHHADWRAGAASTQGTPTLHEAFESAGAGLLAWRGDWNAINRELDELVDLMRDDRMRYLEETAVQSGQSTPYFVHLLGIDAVSKPWTMELMNCASAIGNIVKMQYKAHYRRVRPSTLCPGLTPPWGPAQHPAFPSGHSTVAHLTTLFLLSVDGIAQRFGIYDGTADPASAARPPGLGDFVGSSAPAYGADQRSPLLWLAWRIAKGRERLGLHYPSDSASGRLLAALVWQACLGRPGEVLRPIAVPTLQTVLQRAQAEWPKAAAARYVAGGGVPGKPPAARRRR
ncbi:MAG: hypothetical protein JNL87_11455 [Burkholderiaceae bacterium]|nr:hypothetical protein [Burkholderiaceae bacterium]